MPEELFQEEQWFPPAVGVVLGGTAAAAAVAMAFDKTRRATWARQLLAGAGGLLGLTGLFAPMRTRVTTDGLSITFGLPRWIQIRIAAADISSVEAVTYSPLLEFGGWGIRVGADGTRAYSARGNQGVRIATEKRRYLIGSMRAEELAAALRRVSGALQMESTD